MEDGRLRVLGIVEEQHPDRARLFMQWKGMEWPVLLDSLNLLEVKAIPHSYLIDEHGVIRFHNPKPAELKQFLATNYPAPQPPAEAPEIPVGAGEEAILWKGDEALDGAIERFEKAVVANPEEARARFRLGVALRRRHDSPKRREGDFSGAVSAWRAALALDPNQYIWRRRIQQYGPRLDKPYSFYDWVNTAREEIAARGETPHPLAVEPSGAEFAYPEKAAGAGEAFGDHPDPTGKVDRDVARLVGVESTVVPSTKGDSVSAVRVHLRFTPDSGRKVHWSNEAGNLAFFPETLSQVRILDRQGPEKAPASPESTEERTVEFEVRATGAGELPEEIRGAAFYYVCEDVGGRCLYLRQDIAIGFR